jgi:hypothetical protein
LVLILECCDNPRKHHAAVFNKYSDKRYKQASAFVEVEIQLGFQLPRLQTPKEIMAPPVLSQYENLSYFGWEA